MEVGAGAPLFAQEDVKDYFYCLGVDKKLGEYFALPAIDPALLQQVRGSLPKELKQLMDVSGSRLYPCLRVLPTGFSWACPHEAHVVVARVLDAVPVMRDRRPPRPPPVLGADAGGWA